MIDPASEAVAIFVRSRRRSRRQRGFTLIELIVALVIIGVLTAALLPRIARLRDRAHDQRMTALAGALATAVVEFQGQWRIKGRPDLNIPTWGDETLDANTWGYPATGRRNASAVGRDQDCEDVFAGLLQNGPSVDEADPTKERGTSSNHIEPKLGTGVEFVAGQDGSIPDATIPLPSSPNAGICQFISLYYQSVEPGAPKPTIFYDSRTGSVLLDLDRVY